MPTTDNAGTTIRYEIAGAGPPLVLLHGRLGSCQFWHDSGYVDELAPHHTVIAVDARGHGESNKPTTPDSYHPQAMASDAVSVLDDLKIDQADFFGYSMGGRIGFMTLAYFEDRVHSLIAGGAGPYGPATTSEAEISLADSLQNGMESYLQRMEEMLSRKTPELDRQRLLLNDAEALAALARATADWPNVVQLISETDVHIQLFGGTADPILKLIDRAHHELPSSEMHYFEGLGHGEDLRSPKLVVPLLRDFLDRRGLSAR